MRAAGCRRGLRGYLKANEQLPNCTPCDLDLFNDFQTLEQF